MSDSLPLTKDMLDAQASNLGSNLCPKVLDVTLSSDPAKFSFLSYDLHSNEPSNGCLLFQEEHD